MINKKIIFITLILIGFLAISAVSAVENVTEEMEIADEILSSEDSEIQNIENDEEILGETEGTFNDLNNIINCNDSICEINLTRDYTFSLDTDENYTDGIYIHRAVTINGNGYTINGNYQASMFRFFF